jgi:hypothetical protein
MLNQSIGSVGAGLSEDVLALPEIDDKTRPHHDVGLSENLSALLEIDDKTRSIQMITFHAQMKEKSRCYKCYI